MSPMFEMNEDIRRMTKSAFDSRQPVPGKTEPMMNQEPVLPQMAPMAPMPVPNDNEAAASPASSQHDATADTMNGTQDAQDAQDESLSPIFTQGGIMYGIMIPRSANGRRTYRLNPQVPKRSSKVFGHNGIPVGAWFANRLVALHRGAHGSSMGGICGLSSVGAYSIVVSGNYADLDEDQGDILYYSGSNSHDNLDPTRPARSTANTNALKASLKTRHPVRVLRSSKAQSNWAPACGLRYDGLYRVVASRERVNGKGGLYEQFILHRQSNQTSLVVLCRTSPTAQEKRDLKEFQRGQ